MEEVTLQSLQQLMMNRMDTMDAKFTNLINTNHDESNKRYEESNRRFETLLNMIEKNRARTKGIFLKIETDIIMESAIMYIGVL